MDRQDQYQRWREQIDQVLLAEADSELNRLALMEWDYNRWVEKNFEGHLHLMKVFHGFFAKTLQIAFSDPPRNSKYYGYLSCEV